MIHKIKKGIFFTVFFAHEQQRNAGRQKDGGRCQFEGLKGYHRAEPVTVEPVAGLIMILVKYHKPVEWEKTCIGSECSFPVHGIISVVYKGIVECFNEMVRFSEIFVITRFLPGKQGMQRMMKLVVPLSVQTISAFVLILDIPGIVQVYFTDQQFPATPSFFHCHGVLFQLLYKMMRAVILKGMNRIQPQTVDVEFFQPHFGIPDKIIFYAVAVGIVKIDGFTPKGLVLILSLIHISEPPRQAEIS